MPSDIRKDPEYLDLDESAEDLGEEVQKTNTELEKLKRQLEDIEKQKVRLEELKRRQDELETGKADMLDKLTRSMVTVERETEEAQKRLEQLNAIHNSFVQHLRQIDAISPRLWGANELPMELSKALSMVEDARADYVKSQAKISPDRPSEPVAAVGAPLDSEYTYAEEHGFVYWLKSGFAFTLPIQILAVIALIVWYVSQSTN
jgi:chromosome segregation ATPase